MGTLAGAVDDSLQKVNHDLDLLNLQYSLKTATGVWLEEYGEWFGVPRLKCETDESYRKSILNSVLKPKLTIDAIEDAIRPLLDDPTRPIFVDEMFNHIARYNIAKFSGTHKYQDSARYRHSVISIQTGFLNPEIREALREITAAGVKYYFELLADTQGHPGHEGEHGEVSFLDWVVSENYSIHYNLIIKDIMNSNIFSGRYSPEGKHSGRQVLFDYNHLDKLLGSSMLNRRIKDLDNDYHDSRYPNNSLDNILHKIGYKEDNYQVKRNKRGLPIRSEFSSEKGNRLEQSGTRTGNVDRRISIHQIKPVNRLYSVDNIQEMYIADEAETYVYGVEVYIDRPRKKSYKGGSLESTSPIRKRISGGSLAKSDNIRDIITG